MQYVFVLFSQIDKVARYGINMSTDNTKDDFCNEEMHMSSPERLLKGTKKGTPEMMLSNSVGWFHT